MKFLTLCEGGAVRSVCLASVLRWEFGQDGVPLSGSKSGQDTVDMLSEWADYIVILWPPAAERILTKHAHKIRIFDIGPDVWKNSMHRDLLKIMLEKCEEWRLKEWKL